MNFEGADEPSEGAYATSIPLMHAMNQQNDVMLVFGQNGRVLHPDHGYVSVLPVSMCYGERLTVVQPLRTIIPVSREPTEADAAHIPTLVTGLRGRKAGEVAQEGLYCHDAFGVRFKPDDIVDLGHKGAE